ncbi:MAG: VOC family protein [Bradyrhizobium sp.]
MSATCENPPRGEPLGEIYRVGVAVRDLDAAIERIQRMLGAAPSLRFGNPSQSVRCAWFPMGACVLELIQSTSPDGPVARFIEKRGEGLYLLGIDVDNLDDSAAKVRERGGEVILPQAEPFTPGGSHNFIHPRALCGVLVEMVEGGPRNPAK